MKLYRTGKIEKLSVFVHRSGKLASELAVSNLPVAAFASRSLALALEGVADVFLPSVPLSPRPRPRLSLSGGRLKANAMARDYRRLVIG